jgi:hypothetical protein
LRPLLGAFLKPPALPEVADLPAVVRIERRQQDAEIVERFPVDGSVRELFKNARKDGAKTLATLIGDGDPELSNAILLNSATTQMNPLADAELLSMKR